MKLRLESSPYAGDRIPQKTKPIVEKGGKLLAKSHPFNARKRRPTHFHGIVWK
jgi:hypothetical protein